MSENSSKQQFDMNNVLGLFKYIGIAVLVMIGIFGFMKYKKNQDLSLQNQAEASLFDLEQRKSQYFETVQKDLLEKNKDDKEYKLPKMDLSDLPKENLENYKSGLTKVISQYSGTHTSNRASIELAKIEYQVENNSEAALKRLDGVISSIGDGASLMRAMAFENKGVILENSKKWQEALKSYNDSLKSPTYPLKPLSLLGVARAHSKLGQKDQAKKSLETLIKDFPDTDFAKKARVIKASL